ncbi:MAG: endonuclease/exonuclease/phosphatase family protein [Dermatophilus congolensis]|nr:endonuclease/exonuclease/phosphatase family protein [Dermatophilus congolensis]
MRVLRWAAVGVIVVVALASVLDVDGKWALPVVQAAAPLAAGAGVLLALLVVRWSRLAALAALVASFVLAAPLLPDVFSEQPREPVSVLEAGTGSLTVLASNTFFGLEQPEHTMEAVERVEPDVLVLIEESPTHWKALQRLGIRDRLPFATGSIGGSYGTVVLTNQPMTCVELRPGLACNEVREGEPGRATQAPVGASAPPFAEAFDSPVVRLSDGTLFKAVHAWSPRTTRESRWFQEQSNLVTWRDAHADEPRLVMAGDFNATRSHPVFRRLLQGMEAAPSGYAPWTRTWPVGWFVPPVVQIDHVLARGYDVVTAGVIEGEGSDHLSVWAQLTPR